MKKKNETRRISKFVKQRFLIKFFTIFKFLFKFQGFRNRLITKLFFL